MQLKDKLLTGLGTILIAAPLTLGLVRCSENEIEADRVMTETTSSPQIIASISSKILETVEPGVIHLEKNPVVEKLNLSALRISVPGSNGVTYATVCVFNYRANQITISCSDIKRSGSTKFEMEYPV